MCNPFGGLGLTGGIVDVGGLYDCLLGIHTRKADDNILDIYSKVRRAKYTDFVDPVSSHNIRLLFEQNPDTAVGDNAFLSLCNKAETDPEAAQILKNGANILMYDFTKHYQE